MKIFLLPTRSIYVEPITVITTRTRPVTPDAMKLAVSGSNPACVKSNGAVDESKRGEEKSQ